MACVCVLLFVCCCCLCVGWLVVCCLCVCQAYARQNCPVVVADCNVSGRLIRDRVRASGQYLQSTVQLRRSAVL